MQIKTAMKYEFTPIRMAIIKKTAQNKFWRRCGEKVTLLCCWWECKLIQPLWRTVWIFFNKLGINLPYDPEIRLWVYTLRKTTIRRHTYPSVHCNTIYNTHNMEATRCPLRDEWIKKLWYIYIQCNII